MMFRNLARVAALLACGALLSTASPALAASAASPETSSKVIVFMRDGFAPGANATKWKVKVRDLYASAVSGYAATVTEAQRAAISADPSVAMVATDSAFTAHFRKPILDRRPPAGGGPDTTDSPYPIASYPQFIPYNVDRVEADHSRTAAIDGRNNYVRASAAVLDTGIQLDNPELHVVGGTNCSSVNPSDGGDYGDVEGHGTEVAGVLAAEDNSFGVVGVAPGASLYSVRVLDAGGGGEMSNIICGVDWVTAHRNLIQVVNLSLIDYGTSDNACGLKNHDPLHFAICRSVLLGNVTYVAAAGNDAVDARTEIPAAYPEVITVSGFSDTDGFPGGKGADCFGSDPDDTFASFSNYGPAVDISAAAECIYTDYPGGQLVVDAGTSFAAPAVSGAAALLVANNPRLLPFQVKARILATRDRVHLQVDLDSINEGPLNVSSF